MFSYIICSYIFVVHSVDLNVFSSYTTLYNTVQSWVQENSYYFTTVGPLANVNSILSINLSREHKRKRHNDNCLKNEALDETPPVLPYLNYFKNYL